MLFVFFSHTEAEHGIILYNEAAEVILSVVFL